MWTILYLPWGPLLLLAAGVSAATLLRVRYWPGRPPSAGDEQAELAVPEEGWESGSLTRQLLAAFSLGWFLQAFLLQAPHEYVFAIATIPALFTVATLTPANRSRPWVWASRLVTFGLIVLAVLMHPLLRLDRLRLWAACWRQGSTPEIRNQLATSRLAYGSPDWKALAEVDAFLQRLEVGDEELTCWDDNSHALYLTRGISPSNRFVHMHMWTRLFPQRRQELRQALLDSGQKYIVADLVFAGLSPVEASDTEPSAAVSLPPDLPRQMARRYPWNQPILFRSGRYLVLNAAGPVGAF
jgi:hypothetical protein